MPTAIFIRNDGATHEAKATDSETLLELAQQIGLEGVIGECGGNLSCATCHVYVEKPWLALLLPPCEAENTMLDATYCERDERSRLCCQIKMSQELDGIVVRLPERQT